MLIRDGHGNTAMFCAAMFRMIIVRMFNYTGHGKGEIKHVESIDYDRRNLSINQTRPGLFSGEWHNNHISILAAPLRDSCVTSPIWPDLHIQHVQDWCCVFISRFQKGVSAQI